MNQIENRVEGIIEPDLLYWDVGSVIDEDEDHFIDLLRNFLEDDLEEFLEDDIDEFIDANCAEGNIICADEMSLISAEGNIICTDEMSLISAD